MSCANCSHYINNGWTFSRKTSYCDDLFAILTFLVVVEMISSLFILFVVTFEMLPST